MKALKNKTRRPKAFTIVELMICITILGFILTAVAIAIQAGLSSYSVNEDICRASNMASQALTRITTDLRTALAVQTAEPNSQCTLINSTGDDITYSFDDSENRLYLVTNDKTADDDYVLCENVTAVTFEKTTAFDDSMVEYVQSVQILITISIGDFAKTVSSAAVIRKNL